MNEGRNRLDRKGRAKTRSDRKSKNIVGGEEKGCERDGMGQDGTGGGEKKEKRKIKQKEEEGNEKGCKEMK